MPMLCTRIRASVAPFLILCGGAMVACGSPPPVAPQVPAMPPVAAIPKEKPLDTSPVPAPPGLVLLGRVNKPDAIISAVGSWTHMPLPSGAELVKSIVDDSVADVVDLSQPLDLAVAVRLSRRGVDPLPAVSVVVK
ncbi:MAG TPA: hypothetical protein VM580_17220, partial [Labilithrix sp.]|nr:hypothetical protein [Labilithrix sp.]